MADVHITYTLEGLTATNTLLLLASILHSVPPIPPPSQPTLRNSNGTHCRSSPQMEAVGRHSDGWSGRNKSLYLVMLLMTMVMMTMGLCVLGNKY